MPRFFFVRYQATKAQHTKAYVSNRAIEVQLKKSQSELPAQKIVND